MKRYSVMLKSTNILLNDTDTGKLNKYGFYAHRYLEAKNSDDAGKKAAETIIAEFKDYALNEKDDPPVVYVESIEETDSFEEGVRSNKGATWYVEE